MHRREKPPLFLRDLLDHIETQDLSLVLNVLVEGDYRTTYASTEVLAHEKNPSLLNEMIEERNNMLEAKLGVTLNEIRTAESSTMTDLLRNNQPQRKHAV